MEALHNKEQRSCNFVNPADLLNLAADAIVRPSAFACCQVEVSNFKSERERIKLNASNREGRISTLEAELDAAKQVCCLLSRVRQQICLVPVNMSMGYSAKFHALKLQLPPLHSPICFEIPLRGLKHWPKTAKLIDGALIHCLYTGG